MKKYFFISLICASLVGLALMIFLTDYGEQNVIEQKAEPKKIVAIFIDQSTYNSISTEIQQYKNDIESDLNVEVQLYTGNFQNPSEIRNKMIAIKHRLAGSVLIGNIPIFYFEFDEPYAGMPTLKKFPSDRYYMDLDGIFPDENNNGIPDWTKYEYISKAPEKLYWSGRIKSYDSPNNIKLLSAYFDRNHKYRIGDIEIDKSLFVYSMDIQSGPSGDTYEIYENNMKDSFYYSNLYLKDQVSLIVDTSKSKFLEELDKDYESASINAHGNWHDQQIGNGITVHDIKTVKPKPYFYYLLSCSNGDFSKKDYLAAHYLFDGNGLMVLSYTMPALLGADESNFYMEFLSQGDTFGEAFVHVQKRVNELQATMIGDPTLSVR